MAAMLVLLAFTITSIESADKPIPGEEDCKCNNKLAGKYCGGSDQLKDNKGEKCKKDYIFQCPKNGGQTGAFPIKIEECVAGVRCYQKTDAPTKAECTRRGLGPYDCACANTVAGKYCGSSQYLSSAGGDGCRPNIIYECPADGQANGAYPNKSKVTLCPGGKCTTVTPGQAKCA